MSPLLFYSIHVQNSSTWVSLWAPLTGYRQRCTAQAYLQPKFASAEKSAHAIAIIAQVDPEESPTPEANTFPCIAFQLRWPYCLAA